MTESEDFEKAVNICRIMIGHKATATESEIDDNVHKTCAICPGVDSDRLKLHIQSLYSTYVDDFEILEGRERRQPWLSEYKASTRMPGCSGRVTKCILARRRISLPVSLT